MPAAHHSLETRNPNQASGPLELTRRLQRAERSNLYLRQFAALLAHELAEPARRAAAASERLHERLAGQLDEAAGADLERARAEARRLNEMLLGLSAAGAEAPLDDTAQDIALDRLLGDLWLEFEPELAARGGSLQWGDLPSCRAPFAPLRQVLANLIDNGIRHAGATPPWIEVRAWRAEPHCLIEVSDRGAGFDTRQLPELVRPFRCGERQACSTRPGRGLGLSLAACLVAALGGELLVHSAPGRGSTFRLVLEG